MNSLLDILLVFFVGLSCYLLIFYLYKTRIHEGVHPYTGKKRYALAFEVFRNIAFLAALIYTFTTGHWLFIVLVLLLYLTHLSIVIGKFADSQSETILMVWEYDGETKKRYKDSFQTVKKKKMSQLVDTDKIVFTTHFVYTHPNKKLKIRKNVFDNLVFNQARIEGEFLVLSYLLSVFPAGEKYLFIPAGKTKEAKELVAKIQKANEKNFFKYGKR